jgi:ribosomal protein S18 acetylase RimI-like enzyme
VDGFYSDKNIVEYHLEKISIFLGLHASFPKPTEECAMFSLCRSKDGVVLAFCEIDNRPTNMKNAAPRPYMCNLAVDKKSRRSGLAKELIRVAEEQAKSWKQQCIYLKVEKKNHAAVRLYSSQGYSLVSEDVEIMTGRTILLMRKALHLDIGPECKDTSFAYEI